MAIYLYVYVEQRGHSAWHLVTPAALGLRSGDQDSLVYSRKGLIDALTDWKISGFADPVDPIGCVAELPNDISPVLRDILDARLGEVEVFPGGHVALEHLTTFDWNRPAGVASGSVASQYAHRFERSRPFPEDLRDVLLLPLNVDNGSVVEWTETYGDLVGEEFLANADAIATFAGESPARLVYWAG